MDLRCNAWNGGVRLVRIGSTERVDVIFQSIWWWRRRRRAMASEENNEILCEIPQWHRSCANKIYASSFFCWLPAPDTVIYVLLLWWLWSGQAFAQCLQTDVSIHFWTIHLTMCADIQYYVPTDNQNRPRCSGEDYECIQRWSGVFLRPTNCHAWLGAAVNFRRFFFFHFIERYVASFERFKNRKTIEKETKKQSRIFIFSSLHQAGCYCPDWEWELLFAFGFCLRNIKYYDFMWLCCESVMSLLLYLICIG